MVFKYLPQFLYEDTKQNDIFGAAVFCYVLAAGRYLLFSLLIKFHGLHSRKSNYIYTYIYITYIHISIPMSIYIKIISKKAKCVGVNIK